MTGEPGADPMDGEYLEALRFVRAMFDDPLEDVWFEWSEAKAKALGALVVDVLKATALALGKTTEAEIDEYVSGTLDHLITGTMRWDADPPAVV